MKLKIMRLLKALTSVTLMYNAVTLCYFLFHQPEEPK